VQTDQSPQARLSRQQLAEEGEVGGGYLDRLEAAGLLTPADGGYAWGDVWRVRTYRALEAAGMPLERLASAFSRGPLSLGFLDAMLPTPSPRTGRSFAEFAATFGDRAPLVGQIYEMLGLAHPPPGMQMRQDEEEMVTELIEVWGADPAIAKRAARVVGQSLRQLVEGWTGLHYELYRGIGGDRSDWPEELRAREPMMARRAIRLAGRIPSWLIVREYEQVMTADVIENVELQIDPFADRAGPPAGRWLPAVAFIDLAGYTALTEREGDREAARSTAVFEEAVATAATQHGGRVVKMLGDGALLHFLDARSAIDATLRVRDGLGDPRLRPHAGIDCGPVAERDGDIFGRVVNTASRLAGVAEAGEIVVSRLVAEAAEAAGHRVEAIGERALKGVAAPVAAFRIGTPTA
jgi:adenylate cyclase